MEVAASFKPTDSPRWKFKNGQKYSGTQRLAVCGKYCTLYIKYSIEVLRQVAKTTSLSDDIDR